MATVKPTRTCEHCNGGFVLTKPNRRFCSRRCANIATGKAPRRHDGRSQRVTAEYRAWYHARERCSNPNNKSYAVYGGRGIRVCAEWSASFVAFFAYMGAKPTPKHQLDRIDNDGHYEPGNVRWATTTEQMQNRSVTRWLTYQGETQCLAEWARRYGFHPLLIRKRLKRGWSLEKALTTPLLTGSDRH